MKKSLLSIAFLFLGIAYSGEPVFQTQVQIMQPPTGPNHAATKNYVDSADEGMVKYDADGNLTFQAGMDMNTSIPQPNDPDTGNPVDPVVRTVLDTDNNGNFIVGNPEGELNLQASVRPTTQIGDEATPRRNAFLEDIEGVYETSADHDADMAYKADLVGGRVPESQMAPGAISKNYTVPTQADLVTLTQAVINDRALTGAGTTEDPYKRFLLWAEPPTDLANWVDITGGGGGGSGDSGVVSWAGKSGAVIPEIEDVTGLRAELDDKANASDLASYAPINSPALTGTPTAPTPPASATGGEIMTAAAVNTKMTSNLANTAPSMVRTDGVSTAGSSATVSRSDHEHGIVAATAATATTAGEAGLVVYAADNDTTSRDKAATPAMVATIAGAAPDYSRPKILWHAKDSIGTYTPATVASNSTAFGAKFTIQEDGYVQLYYYYKFNTAQSWNSIGLTINNWFCELRREFTTRSDAIGYTNFVRVSAGDTVAQVMQLSASAVVNLGSATSATYGLWFLPLKAK